MGIVTAISGGAGVFAVPVLLALGIPPLNVLALNRMSDLGVVFGALRNYARAKSIDWKLAAIAAVPMGIGSYIGAKISSSLPLASLKIVIICGIFVGIFFLLKPIRPLEKSEKVRISPLGIFMLVLVGIWSGALGMAGATFAVLVFIYFFRKNFLGARSTEVVAAIPETIIATTVLSLHATIALSQLGIMFVSSFIGAWIGSHFATRYGDTLIKRAMVAIAIIMIIKVLIDF